MRLVDKRFAVKSNKENQGQTTVSSVRLEYSKTNGKFRIPVVKRQRADLSECK